MVFRHRQMPEELQPTDARGRGFESRLCRQRWQSSSEDRARNNFSTSSCRGAPYGRMPAGLHCLETAGSIPAAGNGEILPI
ncbi:hypothetical protein NEIELOOT_02903 [Neisseria elongata subsp. glycolytica ATCC 29315]|uniref:Uncharacterized protein n=1 Tax=Neisseria elongata subsp. glycolytica ATCC 29315 TaxID=546263 RepID=D4DUY9_NEIEG|nr:hypothetical protein NEIELOOT_02903 [Neisseria elongata subsp. glycolytica ATCC 29315]